MFQVNRCLGSKSFVRALSGDNPAAARCYLMQHCRRPGEESAPTHSYPSEFMHFLNGDALRAPIRHQLFVLRPGNRLSRDCIIDHGRPAIGRRSQLKYDMILLIARRGQNSGMLCSKESPIKMKLKCRANMIRVHDSDKSRTK